MARMREDLARMALLNDVALIHENRAVDSHPLLLAAGEPFWESLFFTAQPNLGQ